MVVKDQEKEVKSSSVSSDSEEDRKVNSMDLGNKMKEGGEKEAASVKLANQKGDLKRSRFSMSAGKMMSIIDNEVFEVNAKTKDGDDKAPPLVNTKKLLKLRKDQEKLEAQSNQLKRSWTLTRREKQMTMDNLNLKDSYSVQHQALVDSNAELFKIKGPLGRGLQIQPSGVHAAFCGGTGLLVFIDLVGHLIMRNAI